MSPCIKTIPFTCQNNCIECLKQTVQGTQGGSANRCCLVGHLCLPVRQRLAPFLTCYFGQSEFDLISPLVLTTTKQRYNNKNTTKIKTTKNHATKKCLTPIRHTKKWINRTLRPQTFRITSAPVSGQPVVTRKRRTLLDSM